MIQKIITGGQTGVDRAALDTVIELGIDHGGFCPRERRAEDGIIPGKYKLTELESADYLCRTRENVRQSDGTLVLVLSELTGGTAQTIEFCESENKPLLKLHLGNTRDCKNEFYSWIAKNKISILNVAGPRGSEGPIYEKAKIFLKVLLKG